MTKTKRLTTILLDGGGVIVDESLPEMIHAEIITELLTVLSPGYSVTDYYEDAEEAVWSFAPNIYKYIIWKQCHGDLALFERVHKNHKAAWNERRPQLEIFNGLKEEIVSLSDEFRFAIAGQYGREIIELLDKHLLLQYFFSHITQDDFEITKPDPRYYEQILSRLGVTPQECIMVGDRIDKDVIPAKQVGILTILLRTGIHKYQKARIPFEIPDCELPGVAGLAGAVRQLAKTINE